jgi:hypothetical protein
MLPLLETILEEFGRYRAPVVASERESNSRQAPSGLATLQNKVLDVS